MGAKVKKISRSVSKAEFEEVFKTYFIPLTSFAQKYVPDLDTAKDIAHTVFINLWEKRNNIDWQKSLKSYLFTSVHNRCLNYIRDNKRTNNSVDIDSINDDVAWESRDFIEEQETIKNINKAIDLLPEKCKEIFLLNRFEGMKYAEVAEKLNISVKTVEAQMSKALKTLRTELLQYLKIVILWMITLLKLFDKL